MMSRRTTLVLMLCLLVCLNAYGDSAAASKKCLVLKVTSGGRVLRDQGSLGATLKAGDLIYENDRLELPSGSLVYLAMDTDAKNIIHLEGPTRIKIASLFPTDLALDEGKVFAFLDNKNANRQLQIRTPVSVAAVRGTDFLVDYSRGSSQVVTFQGQVSVFGRDKNGREIIPGVAVGVGKRTAVLKPGEEPMVPWNIENEDKKLYWRVSENIDQVRKATPKATLESALGSKAIAAEDASKTGKSKTPADKGIYIF